MVQFSFRKKENLRFGSVEPSPATVHRTVALNSSNLSVLDFSKKKNTPKGVLSFLFLLPSLDIAFKPLKSESRASKNQIFRSQVSTTHINT